MKKSLKITDSIFSHNSGLMSDLEKSISISEVRKLERLGYIENIITPNGEIWKLSKKGERARDLLSNKRSLYECIFDFVLKHIFGFRVSL